MVPDAPPMESRGVETNTLFADGLWLLGDFQGEFAGVKFQGKSQLGYDPRRGKYVGSWIDSMMAHVARMEGTYDEASKTLTLMVDTVDPATGKPLKERHVHRYLDDETRLLEMYLPVEGGGEVKMMEITYRKRK